MKSKEISADLRLSHTVLCDGEGEQDHSFGLFSGLKLGAA